MMGGVPRMLRRRQRSAADPGPIANYTPLFVGPGSAVQR